MSLVLDIDDIPEDEALSLDLTEKPDHFKVDPEEGVLTQGVHVLGTLSKTGLEIFFNGNISTEIKLICSRCLEPLEYRVQAKVSACYLPAQDAGEPGSDMELHGSDFEVEYYSGHRLDLTQAVYDQMMLSLPIVRLCREDCRGICSQCGVNRNQDDCKCSDRESIDPRLAVLKKLKDKIK
ncbi:MAG: hypothetical protein GWM98_22395 [Nitrospinaceae bacterium]|nr:DUF177 domain-containing protein [Nitrospinaceae bacterium]NIR56698.1 DUF177 domain-containing protein [Nitrospinaceae bacterium]NIS87156.1 DUF177 domain-containing protein [Nitrospinaceae bacterium]NIT84015.1 DUF177 domain-containing protein [Nitrospinaceae bacterium]NIU46207.1 DUF177 domain-containing protein [Nitrospinaceae bacterium]